MVADDITGKDIWGDCASHRLSPAVRHRRPRGPDKLPGVRTIIRSAPDVINAYGYKLKWARWSWAQYSARYGNVTAYRDAQVQIARTWGSACPRHQRGQRRRRLERPGDDPEGRDERTEVLAYGKVFLPYTPIFLNWEYRDDIESRIGKALRQVRAMADTMPAKSC
jgi:hypothetical protein